MSKLLLVTQDYWPRPGGVANYYGGLVRALAGQVAVLTSAPGDGGEGVYRVNYHWPYIWPHWLPLLWLIPKYLKKAGAQAVWVGDVLPVGIALWILNKFKVIPYIVSLHGLDIQLANSVKRRANLLKKILTGAKCITTNSQFTNSLLKNLNFFNLKTEVIYPVAASLPLTSADAVDSIRAHYQLAGKKIILTVSRLVKRKGVADVVRAVTKLRDSIPTIVYAIIGDGPEKNNLAQLINELKAPAVLVGVVTADQLSAWYSLCDVFVLTPKPDPVDVEGYGIVYREAARFGKPVVASRVGGVPEAAGPHALYANSPVEISEALFKLLTDVKLSKSLGKKNYQLAENITIKTEAVKLQFVIDAL